VIEVHGSINILLRLVGAAVLPVDSEKRDREVIPCDATDADAADTVVDGEEEHDRSSEIGCLMGSEATGDRERVGEVVDDELVEERGTDELVVAVVVLGGVELVGWNADEEEDEVEVVVVVERCCG
jgi:hypothetical protein